MPQSRESKPKVRTTREMRTWQGSRRRVGTAASLVVALAAAMTMAGCGGTATGPVRFTPPPRVDNVDIVRKALRHAAYARVAARAGEDAEAHASFRAALHLNPDVQCAVEAARAAERARLFGEAHDDWQQALRLAHDDANRASIAVEVERTAALVPSTHVRVAVLISPRGSRVALTSERGGEPRPLIGDDAVWLAPGEWIVDDPDHPTPGGLARIRVGVEGQRVVAVMIQGRGRASDERNGAVVTKRDPTPQQAADPATPPATKPTPRPDAPQPSDPQPSDPQPSDPQPSDPQPSDPQPSDPPDGSPDVPSQPAVAGVHSWGPYVLAGLGVVGLGAASYFGVTALQNANIANDLAVTRSRYESELAQYGGDAQSQARLANLSFAAGGVLLAGGAVWWLLRPTTKATISLSDDTSTSALAPRLTLGLDGRSVLARWIF
jgi:hypothetical protein